MWHPIGRHVLAFNNVQYLRSLVDREDINVTEVLAITTANPSCAELLHTCVGKQPALSQRSCHALIEFSTSGFRESRHCVLELLRPRLEATGCHQPQDVDERAMHVAPAEPQIAILVADEGSLKIGKKAIVLPGIYV